VIVGAAIVPTTALLLPGVAEPLPGGVGKVAEAAGLALGGLRPFDVAVLLAAATRPGVHLRARTTLAGIGRPDLAVEAEVDTETALAAGAATGWPSLAEAALPLGLAVLAALVRDAAARPGPRVVPVAVPPSAEADTLLRAGESLAGPWTGGAPWWSRRGTCPPA